MGTFGNKLKSLRGKKLQKEVAAELGISITGYSSYENDSRMPGVQMLIKLADYYNVSIDYLLGRDNKTYIEKPVVEIHIKEIKKIINSFENYISKSK